MVVIWPARYSDALVSPRYTGPTDCLRRPYRCQPGGFVSCLATGVAAVGGCSRGSGSGAGRSGKRRGVALRTLGADSSGLLAVDPAAAVTLLLTAARAPPGGGDSFSSTLSSWSRQLST